MEEITAALVKNLLPRRRQDGHKGSFGRVYVYGGSVGYTGAPVFAGEAAVRPSMGTRRRDPSVPRYSPL